jgi:hypothetical protein
MAMDDPLSRLGLVSILTLSAGCAHVAAYDRGQLAHTTMVRADLDGPAAAHVHAVHEGAMGGGSVAESGCGCN